MTNTNGVDKSATPDERRGLLSNVDDIDAVQPDLEEQPTSPATSHKRKRFAGFSVLLSLILAATLFELWPRTRYDTRIGSDTLYSNGTHEFKKTVLMVSIDGLRADYLDRGLTPHLLNISREGLRAKYMKPVFPVRIPFRLFALVLNISFSVDSDVPVSHNLLEYLIHLNDVCSRNHWSLM
jgi:hypothetical protein